MPQVETETEAKQGDKGKSTLTALIVGIVLAVIAAVGVLTWQGAKSPDSSNPSQKNAGDSAAGSTSSRTTEGANPAGQAPTQPKAQ